MLSVIFRQGRTLGGLSLLLACLVIASSLHAAPPVSPNEPYKRQVLFGIHKSEDTGMAFGRLGGLEERLTQIGLTDMVWKFHGVRNNDASTANSKKYAAFVLIAFKVDPKAESLEPIKELKTPDAYLRFGAEVVHLTQDPVEDVRKQFEVVVNEETLMDGNKKGKFLTADGFLLDGVWCRRNRITDTSEENDALRKAAAQAGGTLKADYSATSSEFIWLTNVENPNGQVDARWKVITFTQGTLTLGPTKDRFKVSRSKVREIKHE